MRNILLVAKREYLEQIHGRAFIVSTVLVPLLIVALLGWSSITNRKAASGKHLAIAADNAALANAIRRQMMDDKDAKYTVDLVASTSELERAALQNQVQSKTIDGMLVINSSSDGAITATYTSLASGGFANISGLRNDINRAVAKERQGARLVGIDVDNIFAVSYGIGIACLGAAACLLMPTYYVTPSSGHAFVLVAFTIVVLGGMGSFVGAAVGGFIIGITESLGGLLLGEQLGQIGISLIFILILLLKPTGLFGSKA